MDINTFTKILLLILQLFAMTSVVVIVGMCCVMFVALVCAKLEKKFNVKFVDY